MIDNPKILFDLINLAEHEFPGESQKDNRFQAELIISHVLGIKPVDIYLPDFSFTGIQYDEIVSLFSRRKSGEPLQYVIGRVSFMNLELFTGQGVLIPRPETEELAGFVIDRLYDDKKKYSIVDVGTGSGAIALSIAQAAPQADVTGIDISLIALEYAEKNKAHNHIENVKFHRNNLLSGFKEKSIDVIVANLPYVTEEEYANLDSGVKNYEPEIALNGGKDGLDLIRITVLQSCGILKCGGLLFLEFGFRQGNAVRDLLKNTDCFESIEIIRDYNKLQRFACAVKAATHLN